MRKKITAFLLCLTALVTMNGCSGVHPTDIYDTEANSNPAVSLPDNPSSADDTLSAAVNLPDTSEPPETAGIDNVSISAVNLMAEITPAVQSDLTMTEEAAVPIADFAIRLFKESLDHEGNTMISPISVLCALAMTANGADNNTLAQMEEVFGLNIGELNEILSAYMNSLPSTEYDKLSIANSIWFRDNGIDVEQDFLQTNGDYYGADLYAAPFDDVTKDEINGWVNENTDGMIPSILDEIPESAVMYLINAVAFDAEWSSPYQEYQLDDDAVFTREDGSTETITLMHSTESRYLEDETTTGFIKNYKNHNYAFAALLPREGITIEEYINSLTGEKFRSLLDNIIWGYEVNAALPKFESEYSIEMSDVLKTMGMTDAFDSGAADFTRLGTSPMGNIFINRVLHKTYISVDEKGTKAAAVTAVEAPAESIPQYKDVICDRPFVYAIIDCETNLPIFIGTVTAVGD